MDRYMTQHTYCTFLCDVTSVLTRRTSHASLVKWGEGKQPRINCCSVLQQQLDTFKATGCTGITQRSATIYVTSINLEGTQP